VIQEVYLLIPAISITPKSQSTCKKNYIRTSNNIELIVIICVASIKGATFPNPLLMVYLVG